jgi:hypothetical protein
MGKCSVCGCNEIAQKRMKCLRCHVRLCIACAADKGIIVNEQGYRYVYCPKCAEEELQVRLSRHQASQQAHKSVCSFCGSESLQFWVQKTFSNESQKTVWDAGERCTECGMMLDSQGLEALKEAEKAETDGRFEESARLFDELKMHDRAGHVRDKYRRGSIKAPDLEATQLLQQLRAGGFAIPYKCTHCGARIRFDKDRNAEKFFICEHCHQTLEPFDLEKVLSGLF